MDAAAQRASEVRGALVLGMHRSGTSAITRSLNLLGLSVGDPALLKTPSEVNARGFWEVVSLTRFNDGLLERAGGGWAGPPSAEALAALADGDEREQARGVFEEVFGGRGSWVWKDPRVCVLLPFWRQVLERDPVLVITHRNPIDIASSLRARDGFPFALGLALCERYMRDALVEGAGLPALVQSYEDFVRDPVAGQSEQAEFLNSVGLPRSDAAAEGGETIDEFVDSGLRHWSNDTDAFLSHPAVTPSQQQLFSALRELAGSHEALPEIELADPDEESTLLLESYGRMQAQAWGLKLELRALKAELKAERGEAKRLRKRLDKDDSRQ